MITVLAILTMALGLTGVLRAVATVAMDERGRFPFDRWISILVGFGLILLGQALLKG